MPKCCNSIHVGWVCPMCGKPMTITSHIGNEPVSVGKIKNVTIVQGDYVKGSIIKDSVVMGDVPSQAPPKENVKVDGNKIEGNISEDSVIMSEDLDI
tara:strand:+ start:163 stop:453 length:291 start_codon:yes stop_codon:yes gene_type:complete